jgi:SAM-dependent methyltransferase
MAAEPVRAGADWLALREPADAAARSVELAEELRRWLPRPLEVHDLGCGTGSMARWLAPLLPGAQRWVLHDRDTDLLERVAEHPPPRDADGGAVRLETRRSDITRLDPAELRAAGLVTASALLDMMTAAELDRFVRGCAGAGCPVLVTLSVVGRVELSPPDRLDDDLMAAFNAHQRRPTDGGRLLGPDAAAVAAEAFAALGRDVIVRASPWRLGAAHFALVAEWLSGWVAAAVEQRPELREAARYYARRRLDQAAAGTLSVTVHHEDLLTR